MQKILVVSNDFERNSEIVTILERNLPFNVHYALDDSALATHLESKVFQLAIMDAGSFDEASMKKIIQIKTSLYSLPILVIADKIPNHMLERLHSTMDIHLLIRPITEKSLSGLVKKLMISRKVPKQQFPRFSTNQIAQIEDLGEGDSVLTNMYNLSKGGAYCEFEAPKPLTVGDLIRVKVQLSDTKNEYALNAKVVWTTPKGRFSGRFGCGLRFISAQDAYRGMI